MKFRFVHVKRHSNDFFNDEADRLAKQGAELCVTPQQQLEHAITNNERNDTEPAHAEAPHEEVDLSTTEEEEWLGGLDFDTA